MQDTDDFIHLHATDQTIALDFSWKLRWRRLDFHETEIDYQDADCRCHIRIDRLDLAMQARRRFVVRREWLVVEQGTLSAAQIDAIIARLNRVLRWPAE